MAAYTKTTSPTGTLTKSALDAEIALVLAAARSIDNTQIRTAATLSHRKLEYPRTVATVPGAWPSLWAPYWTTGCGRPTVITNEHGQPTFWFEGEDLPALNAIPEVRAAYANHVIAVVTVPNFTHSTAQIPRVRIASVSMTTVHPLVNPWPNESSGMKTAQDVANEMSAIVYRVTPSRVNSRVPDSFVAGLHPFDFLSDKVELSMVARKDGLDVPDELSAHGDPISGSGGDDLDANQFITGAEGATDRQGVGLVARSHFQALTLMGGESFGTMAPMVPGDNILLVLTGTDLLLDPQIDTEGGNVYTPVMPAKGAAWSVDFEAEWAQ